MIHFSCPTCHQPAQAQDDIAGKKVHCPACGQKMRIPIPVNPVSLNKTVLGKVESAPSLATTSPIPPWPANTTESLSAGFGSKYTMRNTSSLTFDRWSALPWRYLSFSWLFAVVIFGFLPWCEVGCNGGRNGLAIRVTQSGYQALYGSYTSPLPSRVEDELQKEGRNRIENAMRGGTSKEEKDRSRKALQEQLETAESYLAIVSPFLIVFWSGVLVMAGFVCFTRLGRMRLRAATLLCGILLAVLSLHAAMGLPMERNAENALVQDFRDHPVDADRTAFMSAFIKIDKTHWFWLTMCSVVALLATEVLVNWLIAERWLAEPREMIPVIFMVLVGTALSVFGCVGQYAAYRHKVGWMENLLTEYDTAEGIEQRRHQQEERRRHDESERLRLANEAEARKNEAEAKKNATESERLRRQIALEEQKERAERERRLREQAEEERRRQQEKEKEDLQALLAKRKAEAEARKRAEQEAKERTEQEAREKAKREAEEAAKRNEKARQARIDREEVEAKKLMQQVQRLDARRVRLPRDDQDSYIKEISRLLQQIIEKYPDTPSAATSRKKRKELDNLQE